MLVEYSKQGTQVSHGGPIIGGKVVLFRSATDACVLQPKLHYGLQLLAQSLQHVQGGVPPGGHVAYEAVSGKAEVPL